MGSAEDYLRFIPEYLLPLVAVAGFGFVIVKSLYDQATSRATAAIEVTPDILEGVREDLRHATERADAAAREAEEVRHRAEDAERARDEERSLRRRVEDEYHAYRIDARIWTAALLAQVHATGQTPVEAPEGFEI